MHDIENRPAGNGAASKEVHVDAGTGSIIDQPPDSVHTATVDDGETQFALDVARTLADYGVPIFFAKPATKNGVWDPDGGHRGSGYWLPPGWQLTEADPTVIDHWIPGHAICAVMGHPVDGVDVDPRSGGDTSRTELQAAGIWPYALGEANTPSGGQHYFVNPLHVRSLDKLRPGLDIKAGVTEGRSKDGVPDDGRGFLFIAPTIRRSKTTHELAPYTWVTAPNLDELDPEDDSGQGIARLVHQTRLPDTGKTADQLEAPDTWDRLGPDQQKAVHRWLDFIVEDDARILTEVAKWQEGRHDKHGRGWQKIVADIAYRYGAIARADWNPWTPEGAHQAMRRAVPDIINNEVPVANEWRAQHHRSAPAGWPATLNTPKYDSPTTLDDLVATPAATEGTATTTLESNGTTDHGTQLDAEIANLADRFALEVATEAHKLRVREQARLLIDRENAPPAADFDAALLHDLLNRPPEPPYRVADLIPSAAAVLLVAQRKTGKTTFALNLARSLLTGEPFLNRFNVLPITGKVAFLNFEVSGATFATWANEAGIPADRILVVNLRGRRNPFAHPDDQAALAQLLRDHDVESVFVDPFGRAYTGTTQNDAGEVGTWLMQLDAFTRTEVGAQDLILAAHAGWNGERTRGSSALEDWADVVITLTGSKDEDDPSRFMRAIGRDVDIEEDQLKFEPTTRRLSLTGAGSRRAGTEERAIQAAMVDVLAFIKGNPDSSGNQIEEGVGGRKGMPTKARKQLVADGIVFEQPRRGQGGGKMYTTTEPPPTVPNRPPGPVRTSPTSPYRGEVLEGTFDVEVPPKKKTAEPTRGCTTCGEQIGDLRDAYGLATCVTHKNEEPVR